MGKEQFLFIFKIIGSNIHKSRTAKKLSQEELALKVGTARNYIGCIERAEKYPSVVMLYKIAQILGIKLSDLFFDL